MTQNYTNGSDLSISSTQLIDCERRRKVGTFDQRQCRALMHSQACNALKYHLNWKQGLYLIERNARSTGGQINTLSKPRKLGSNSSPRATHAICIPPPWERSISHQPLIFAVKSLSEFKSKKAWILQRSHSSKHQPVVSTNRYFKCIVSPLSFSWPVGNYFSKRF